MHSTLAAEARQLDLERFSRTQDMALVLVSGMAVILAVGEMTVAGRGTRSVPMIIDELTRAARRTTGFAGHVIHQLGARRLDRREAGLLFPALPRLCQQAGLTTPPDIYLVPGWSPNAFALGDASRSAILVTQGLLAALGPEEMAGVLAHEIGHIVNADAHLLAFAAELNRLVAASATATLVKMALLSRSASRQAASDLLQSLLWSLMAPILSRLLQCALSRVREFDADRIAMQLVGQPFWLMGALEKLNLLVPMARPAGASALPSPLAMLLSTHPDQHQRVARLLAFGRDRDRRAA
jgi:heat shock protein HtpX